MELQSKYQVFEACSGSVKVELVPLKFLAIFLLSEGQRDSVIVSQNWHRGADFPETCSTQFEAEMY